MAAVLLVIFVRTHGKAQFPVRSQHIAQLEVPALILAGAGLTHADKAAALIHKFADGAHHLLVLPVFRSAPGSVGVSGIDKYPDIWVYTLPDLIESQKLHIHRHSAQAFDHSHIGINFPVPQGMMYLVGHPSPDIAPAVQNTHLERSRIGPGSLHILMDLPEFLYHPADLVDKARPLRCQLQITAVSDPIQRGAQNSPSGLEPVVLGLPDGISPFRKHIREEIGQQTSFSVFDSLYIRNHPQSHPVSHGTYHGIQADAVKIFSIGLRADPVIPQEHHGFLAVTMHNVHQFFGQLTHFDLLELHEIPELFGGHPENGIMIALIHDILGTERIPRPFFKLLQNIGTDAGAVAKPLHKFFPLLVVKGQGELVKKGGKTHHIHMGILLAPFPQFLFDISLGLGLAHIKGKLMGRVLPVVGDKIVHMYRVPDQKSQETHRILVIGNSPDHHLPRCLLIFPLIHRHHFSRGSVHHLPPTLGGINGIHPQLLGVETLHKFYSKLAAPGRHPVADQVLLLDFLRIFHSPVIVFSGSIVSGVNLCVLA